MTDKIGIDDQYPTLARLANPANTTISYQSTDLISEAVSCYRRLKAIEDAKGWLPEEPESPLVHKLDEMEPTIAVAELISYLQKLRQYIDTLRDLLRRKGNDENDC